MLRKICPLLLLLPIWISAHEPVGEFQETKVWFAEDWHRLYIEIVLVPEEDSPFHYGVWGYDRGTHLFEIGFLGDKSNISHSPDCLCGSHRYISEVPQPDEWWEEFNEVGKD